MSLILAYSFLVFFAEVEVTANSFIFTMIQFLLLGDLPKCLQGFTQKIPFFYYLEVDGPTSPLSSPTVSFPLAGLSSTCLVMRLNFGII